MVVPPRSDVLGRSDVPGRSDVLGRASPGPRPRSMTSEVRRDCTSPDVTRPTLAEFLPATQTGFYRGTQIEEDPMRDAVIVEAVRTPVGKGKPGGAYAEVHPVELHAHAIRSAVERVPGLRPGEVDDVIGGVVGQVGEQSGNTTRFAALAAGLPESVPATTVDRQCGSSQQALSFAAQGVIAGAYDVVVASGVESMSHVPIGSSAN